MGATRFAFLGIIQQYNPEGNLKLSWRVSGALNVSGAWEILHQNMDQC
jgi:hypothetical protein